MGVPAVPVSPVRDAPTGAPPPFPAPAVDDDLDPASGEHAGEVLDARRQVGRDHDQDPSRAGAARILGPLHGLEIVHRLDSGLEPNRCALRLFSSRYRA
jgi:hypothetical protein